MGYAKCIGCDTPVVPFAPEISLILAERRLEKTRAALEELQTWANAYPVKTFSKPDLGKAAKVLKEAGMTLDAISANNMRHVLDGIKDIVEQALKESEEGSS